MTTDDEFEPELGSLRSRPGAKSGKSLRHVMRRVARSTGSPGKGKGRRFDGSRIGRGSGAARVLRSRDRHASFRTRRVVIQTRIIRLKRASVNAARLHLRYLQRDGVTRQGERGELYDAKQDRADGRTFLERSEDDRHQFRFIVSAEDGTEYDDLKPFVRRLLSRMEDDLGTELDWVAVDHHNTGHPHTHVVLRGKDETGRDLVIAREYITHGMRARAGEIVTLDLGPRSDLEIENRLRREVEQERFTSLDRTLLREVDADGFVRSGRDTSDSFRQSLRAGRLRKLESFALAHEVSPGRWVLAPDLERTLRRLGERGDIIKAIHREMAEIDRGAINYATYDPDKAADKPLVGRVLAQGLSDEIKERRYLIVDGVDARAHYVEIGDTTESIPTGTIIAITPNRSEPRPADRTVATIADANGGRYSAEIHRQHDPSATADYIAAHIRRLEALRRLGGIVEREADGSWRIPPDHLVRAATYERKRGCPVVIEMLSTHPLEQLVTAHGATWLDRELVAQPPTTLRDGGFGHDVREALARRRQWLIEQDLARIENDRIIYRAGMLSELKRRDLARAGAALGRELGLPYVEAAAGQRIEGTYRRTVDLTSGKFAVIETSRQFTLVPWRPALERGLGKPVSGVLRGDTISWTINRSRSGPSIS